MKRTTTAKAGELAFAQVPFKTSGALSGQRLIGNTGRLPHDWRVWVHANYEYIDYVVYSYGTPIAWHDNSRAEHEGWVIPNVRYSVTTSKHQSIIRRAILHSGQMVWTGLPIG